jgi:hypothetical protein
MIFTSRATGEISHLLQNKSQAERNCSGKPPWRMTKAVRRRETVLFRE